MVKTNSKKKLQELTETKELIFTKRGNKAIEQALKIAKNEGKTKLLIPDQGGWITYKPLGEKLKFEIIELKTDYGLIDSLDIDLHTDEKTVLLINSLAGYFAEQPMEKIEETCKRKNTLVINDVSGSIGTDLAKYGDIIVGSFGRWKPIWVGEGGFIAVKDKQLIQDIEIDETIIDDKKLEENIDKLPQRLAQLHMIVKKIKKDLEQFTILHRQHTGLNVIVAVGTTEEKQKVINYCEINNYEFTICPRDIRVMCDAISIEVKRIQ